MPSPLPRRNRWCRIAPPCSCPGLAWLPTAAAFPVTRSGRLPHYPFRGLLDVHSHSACMFAESPESDPFHRRLRRFRYLHRRSDCYRLERPLAGWESHPLKIAVFSRHTVENGSTSASKRDPPGSFNVIACSVAASPVLSPDSRHTAAAAVCDFFFGSFFFVISCDMREFRHPAFLPFWAFTDSRKR